MAAKTLIGMLKEEIRLHENRSLIIGHIICWLAYTIFMISIVSDIYGEKRGGAILQTGSNLIINAAVFYISALWLMPRFLKTGQYTKRVMYAIYAISLIILASIIGYTVTQSNYEASLREQLELQPSSFFFIQAVGPVCFFVFGATYALAVSWIKNLQSKSVLKNQQLETELKLLKSQVQPHFLFNTLNNIYTLCYLKDDRAAPMVMNLSKLLRYTLYDGQADKVPLQKEINFLHNLVNLQELKNTEEQKINLQCDNVKGNLEIAPLLLLNFFENAFKHGDWDSNKKAWMNAHLSVDNRNILHFDIDNSTNGNTAKLIKTSEGIGLDNVKRRLNLIYPHRHHLSINHQEEKGIFSVNLSINLS